MIGTQNGASGLNLPDMVDIRAVEEKIRKGQWDHEIPAELKVKAKKNKPSSKKIKLKNLFKRKKA